VPQASLAVGAVKDGDAVHSIVASAPASPMVGACVSLTVIVCVLVADVFPHASIASQVLVLVKLLAQVPAAVTSLNNLTVDVPQASLAVGAVKDGDAVHSIVASAPASPMAGACVSLTVMVCVLVADVFPQASIASQVRVRV
jgi:predicted secreted protein